MGESELTGTAVASPNDHTVRRDIVLLAIGAALVRFIVFDRVGVDHFDAGAYAMTSAAIAKGEVPGGLYPLFHFLSPPLYFGVCAALMLVLGSTSAIVLATVSALSGVATVVAVYLAGRQWFGRGVGGASALMLAMADFHILYSRTGLTDVLFCALFVYSLVVFARAEERESNGLAALAGLLIGLAWNTKYHGWLAGVIAGAAVIPSLVQGGVHQRRGIVLRLCIAATIAIVMYVPWVFVVQSQVGGYAELTAEHTRFLRPSALLANGLSQVRAQRYLEGWATRLSLVAAIAWLWLVVPSARRISSLLWAAGLLALALAVGVTPVIGLLATAAAILLLVKPSMARSSHWFALAFFGVFTVLTPLYTPYPRLLLPWFIASLMLSGFTIEWLITYRLPSAIRIAAPIGLLVVGTVLVMSRGLRSAAFPWRPSNVFQASAHRVSRLANGTSPIFVVGEPALVFELRRLGRPAWHIDRPAEVFLSLRPGASFYLVGGIYSRRIGGRESLAAWLDGHPKVVLAGTAPVATVGDVRLLDDFSSDDARSFRRDQHRDDYDLRVYYVTGTSP